MNTFYISVTDVVNAAPDKVYGVFSDYEVNHPAILPKPTFQELVVEKGGQGAGTEIAVHMLGLGKKQTLYMVVSEPEPGRVLVETDRTNGLTTTFTVEPINGGSQSRVTIASDLPINSKLFGFLEKFVMKALVNRLYKQEIRNVDAYVQKLN